MTQTITPMSRLGIADHPERDPSDWRLLTVGVPAGWIPQCWRSAPPHSSAGVTAPVACAMAVLLNADRMRRGPVRSWTFRIRHGDGSSWLTAELPDDGWQPSSPYDIPPCATEVACHDRHRLREIIEGINACNPPTRRTVAVLPLDHTGELFEFLADHLRESPEGDGFQCHADSLQMAFGPC